MKRIVEERRITDEHLEELGRLVDRVINLVHAGLIPMPDRVRVVAISESLPSLRDDLKNLYIEIAGENPWKEEDT